MIEAVVARESVDGLLKDLVRLGVPDDGSIEVSTRTWRLKEADRAADRAPGRAGDALVWGRSWQQRTGQTASPPAHSVLLTVATMLAAIGILTDSAITVVGAMVVGPSSARSPHLPSAWSIGGGRSCVGPLSPWRSVFRWRWQSRLSACCSPRPSAWSVHIPWPYQGLDPVHLPARPVVGGGRPARGGRRHGVTDLEPVGRTGRCVHLGHNRPGRRLCRDSSGPRPAGTGAGVGASATDKPGRHRGGGRPGPGAAPTRARSVRAPVS